MQHGTSSVISTKLRLGDANSMMSQGGMQAAVTPQDSPSIHYLDAIGGGHFDNKPDLVAPVLLPSYTPQDVRRRQLTAHYEGTLQ